MKINEKNAYVPKGIALFPSYECPADCPHCNIQAGASSFARLTPETGKRLLNEARSLSLHAFQFVGGEPTLYEEFLIEVFREGRRIGMKCHRPPTNCFLGGNEKRMRKLFSALKNEGFNSGFRISVDKFHKRIPIGWISRFIACASEYFDLKRFRIGCCDIDEENSRSLLQEITDTPEMKGLNASVENNWLKTDCGDIKIGFWAPTRPTRTELPDSEFFFRTVSDGPPEGNMFSRSAPITKFGCLGSEGVGYLWVDPTGAVRACCGNAVNFIDKLIIGNIYEESLSEIVARAAGSPLIRTLSTGGPVSAALEAGSGHLLDSKYTHRCELCYKLLKNSK